MLEMNAIRTGHQTMGMPKVAVFPYLCASKIKIYIFNIHKNAHATNHCFISKFNELKH